MYFKGWNTYSIKKEEKKNLNISLHEIFMNKVILLQKCKLVQYLVIVNNIVSVFNIVIIVNQH